MDLFADLCIHSLVKGWHIVGDKTGWEFFLFQSSLIQSPHNVGSAKLNIPIKQMVEDFLLLLLLITTSKYKLLFVITSNNKYPLVT